MRRHDAVGSDLESIGAALRITEIEPMVLRAPEVDVSRADGTQDAFLVRVRTDEGLVGIGEADTSPYVARTIVEMPSSHSIARGLAELLVGRDPLDIGGLWDLMYRGTYHYGRFGAALHAMSAIDIALWDIAGKSSGRPVVDLLGGARTDRVRVYASEVMPETPEQVREIAARAVDDGYSALKLGWGPLGRDLDRDVELVIAARETIGIDRSLMLDGGMGYTVESATELMRRLRDVGLGWLEEPIGADDLDGYARLADAVDVPLAAGEAETTFLPFRALAERGRVRVLQPDLARCGGFTVARRIRELIGELGVDVVPHCFSSGVLVAASLHFVASLDRPSLSEFSIARSPFVRDILATPFDLEDGTLPVTREPGLGVELDEDVLERYRVE